MALALKPTARYMILCDDVVADEQRPGKLLIVGLISSIRWAEGTTETFTLPKLCVHLVLTDGHGRGTVRISCINEETDEEVFSSQPQSLSFEGKSPEGLYGVTFRLNQCVFPEPGVYVVRFLFEDEVAANQVVHVR